MLLAIETSTRTGSVALMDGDRVVAYRALDDKEKHGTLLAPAVASIPELDFARVEAYAIGIGPGSFTGLRIGLAFVKGLALVYPRPAIPVSTLEVIARQLLDAHRDADRALPMIDARRHEAYAGLFRRTDSGVGVDPAFPEGAYPVKELAARARGAGGGALIAGGDGVLLEHEAPVPWTAADRAIWTPDARVLAKIAVGRLADGQGVDVLGLEPIYHQLSPAEANAADKTAT